VKGFREFIMRGNVVDLAVAVTIGVAFTAVIAAFTKGIISPLIAAIFGKPNLDSVGTREINGALFSVGVVLTALVTFVITAAVLYYLVVLPMNKMRERYAKPQEAVGPTEVELLTEIRDALRSSS